MASPDQECHARFGSCLEHGGAHTEDHRRWSRRDFLTGLGLATGATVVVGGTPVQALGFSSFLHRLRASSSDRILVLIQLFGGNDGLNTIIPTEDDLYYNARPSLAIAKNVALPLDTGLGMHPSMTLLRDLYDDGQMSIVQGVGYDNASLSHFRSTDIWMSGSESNSYLTTGWAGRQLEFRYPDFGTHPTDHPLAVQIGTLGSLLFTGAERDMGIAVANPALFQRLAREAKYFDEQSVPATPFGEEMRYVRRTANDTFRYGIAIQESSSRGYNDVSYPAQNYLAQSLSIVARLIKGDLGAHVYHVGIGGFDTHGTQGSVTGAHALLLRKLSEAVFAFLKDIRLGGRAKNVLVMTFSEFGRRVEQNGSGGTDHGTAAPLFMFGETVNGGLYGDAPSLSNLDPNGNLLYQTDFRVIYSTVLQHWFGFSSDASQAVLGRAFDPLGLVRDPAGPLITRRQQAAAPEAFALRQNYPNPFNPTTVIPYTLRAASPVRLDIYDAAGRHVRTLVDAVMDAGSHEVPFDGSELASGMYLYRLQTSDGVSARQMALVR